MNRIELNVYLQRIILCLLLAVHMTLSAQRYEEQDYYQREGSLTGFYVDDMYFEVYLSVLDKTENGMAILTSPLNNEDTSVTGGFYHGILDIPDEVYNEWNKETYKVGSVAGLHRNWISSLKIPDTVISLRSVSQCDYLEEITFGTNIRTLDDAVYDCPLLKSCEIPKSVTTMEYSFCKLPLVDHITVPESLEVCQYNFNDNTGLKTVVLPDNTLMMLGCFNGCKNIESIINYSTEPNQIYGCFLDVDRSRCTLYVPKESIDVYRKSRHWNKYADILPIEDTYVDYIYSDDERLFRAESTNGSILINNTSIFDVEVHDISGRCVSVCAKGKELNIQAASGLYLISNGRHSVKTFVR